MSKKQKNKLKVKKMNAFVYVCACLIIASALMIAVIVGLAEFSFVHLREINLVIETESAVKLYDGEPLVGSKYEIVHGALAAGHSIRTGFQSSQTEVGECINRMEFYVFDSSGTDVTEQYNIEQRSGRLKVASREVDLRIRSATKVYDGLPLSDSGLDVIGGQGFAEGHTAYLFSSPEIVDVGEIANNGVVKVKDENGIDVTDQYLLEVEEGVLRVEPRKITVSTGSESKPYDGLPLTDPEWSFDGGSLLHGHRLEVKCTGSIIDAGAIGNDAIVNVFDENDQIVTGQYEVLLNMGTLSISPKTLYIATGSAERIYDGTALISEAWQITSGELAPGERIELAGRTELYEVGTVQNKLIFVIRDATGKDITSRYAIYQSMGNLTVNPRKITVSTGSAQKKYDGTALYSDTFKLISGSLCSGHTLSVVGARRVAVGISENVPISYAIYQEKNGVKSDVTDCYQITFSYGTLTVKP